MSRQIFEKHSILIGISFVLPFLSSNSIAETVVYDAAADWSDIQNPNGVWTYTGNNGAILTVNQPVWDPGGVFFSGQSAWADSTLPKPGHVPIWLMSSDPSALDMPGVGMHGSEGTVVAWVGIVWRSPVAGQISITGGVWQALKTEDDGLRGSHRARNSDWRLRLNDKILASGNISGTDGYSSAFPLTFTSGTGGRELSGIGIAAGDKIVLEFISPTSFATFNGIDLVITASEERARPMEAESRQ